MTSTTFTANTAAITVSSADSFPTSPSGWTPVPGMIAVRAQEPLGQVVGMAEIHYFAGVVMNPTVSGGPAVVTVPSFVGTYVMIQMAGTPIWYGYVQLQTTVPDGAGSGSGTPGATVILHCVGLGAILDQIYLHQGFVQGYSSGAPSQMVVIENPLFNALPTKSQNTLGERSASQDNLWNSDNTAYYFDLVARSNPWSAADVINYLLNGYAQPQLPPDFTPVGPRWQLSDPVGFCDYIPDKLDFEGKSLLECINLLVSPRRGGIWYPSTDGSGVITINVMSCSGIDIVAGDFTLPATDTTVDLDARGNPLITGLSIDEDMTAQFDYIQVRGNRPLIGMSLYFNLAGSGSLVKGWDPTQEANWDPTINQGPAFQYLWSRYLLAQTWNGHNYLQTTIGLRNNLGITGNGYDGTRGFATGGLNQNAPAQMLTLEPRLPLPFNQDYSTTPSAASLDMTQPLLGSMVFIFDSSDSSYTDITDDYDIDVETNPPAVIVRGDMDNLQSLLTATATLIVTLGVREADPMVVSWQTDTPINDVPRVLDRRLPNCEQWLALQGTVMKVHSTGSAFDTLTSTLTVVDDNPKLYGWLAALQYWYGQSAVSVTWTDHSGIDAAYGDGEFQPGALLTTVQRGDVALDCNAIITGRAWDFTDENWGTTYSTERILPDVDSVDGHPRVNFTWKSQAERDETNA